MAERLNINDVMILTGLSKASLYRRMADPILPFPRQAEGRFWDKAAVESWMSISAKIAELRQMSEAGASLISLEDGKEGYLRDWKWAQTLPADWKPWLKL